jgi:hypothetical protein
LECPGSFYREWATRINRYYHVVIQVTFTIQILQQ